MTPDVQFLLLLAIIAVFFITELIPLAVTAMGGAIACGLLGFIPPKAVFAGLANSTVVLFAGMFVVGAAMFHTGLAQSIGKRVVLLFGTKEKNLMLGIMIVGAVLSGFLSNTGTTACLMPVVLGICAAAKLPASRQLLPLAFGVAFGGIFTIVGTPPNLIASDTLAQAGFRPFGFFEFAYIGIPIAIAGIIYMMFIGYRFLLFFRQRVPFSLNICVPTILDKNFNMSIISIPFNEFHESFRKFVYRFIDIHISAST